MPDQFIADVSEWQSSCNWLQYVAAGFLAAVARVCHGTSVDLIMPGRRDSMRASGLRSIGWYLFLNSFQDVAAQVATFTSIIPKLLPGEYVVLDWEKDDRNIIPTAAQRDQALALLDQYYNQHTYLYSFDSLLRTSMLRRALAPLAKVIKHFHYARTATALAGRKVWVAAYATGEPTTPHVMWQFTNGQYVSGGYRPVNFAGVGQGDATVYHGTIEQLIADTTGALAPPAPPPWTPAENPPVHYGDGMIKVRADIRVGPDGCNYRDVQNPVGCSSQDIVHVEIDWGNVPKTAHNDRAYASHCIGGPDDPVINAVGGVSRILVVNGEPLQYFTFNVWFAEHPA